MRRKSIIAFSISTTLLIAVCISFIAYAKEARDDAHTLAEKVGDLETANHLLQSENNALRDMFASGQPDNIIPTEAMGMTEAMGIMEEMGTTEATDTTDETYATNAIDTIDAIDATDTIETTDTIDVTDTQKNDTRYIDSIFAENPIDRYFFDRAQQINPTSTVEMAQFGYITCAAWEAEMVNCYDILKNIAKDQLVRDCLDKDRETYIEYCKANTALSIYFDASAAFYGEEDAWCGTISHVLHPAGLSESYKKKTMELFGRLYEIGEKPLFIFSAEEYDKQLQQAYPEKWPAIYD